MDVDADEEKNGRKRIVRPTSNRWAESKMKRQNPDRGAVRTRSKTWTNMRRKMRKAEAEVTDHVNERGQDAIER